MNKLSVSSISGYSKRITKLSKSTVFLVSSVGVEPTPTDLAAFAKVVASVRITS